MDVLVLFLSQSHLVRSSYQHDKMIAATARKIFTGERVATMKKVPNDLALWLLVMGEGFVKVQYTFVKFSVAS